ncbi:hypothetical protein AYO21_08067 [Fonsecaea monophora]|uniref:5'-3' DNA helicase ZGRF1-like N-terminal domain-containing protein n=1 Tax=Fonsecaea monophora TaxID=254056 RepID=A0A177F065_9EURO|nr:hypothetical protein AYO21_08067 [Fonsecaea monophora]KAH0846666.1 hypothetical protein FOPE_11351 [Fonsecaea pedrosoi]OAG37704.1 hypothetical protein AYO21_08067 [Fonsecaea monophora]
MSGLTSTHGGSASARLTVAPTQNTAPVHEFRCLYTRDLRKKAKKWHDGSLRFHTFNRRVMVYDDAKNYIGDLHYRQEEEFTEGVEIQLDRGVMVEVGERLGETQTDLAPILERARPEKPTPLPRQTTASATRPLSTGPSQRPKSLLEVLGPSQGRPGRARLPAHSPYEQRRSANRVGLVGSPQKKQRLDSDKENQFDHVHQPVRPVRPRLPQPMQPSKPVPQTRGPPMQCEDMIDLSLDEEPIRQVTKPTRLGARVVVNEPPEEQWLTPELPHARPTLRPQLDAGKEKVSKERRQKSKAPEKLKTRTNGDSSTTFRPPVARTSRLLIGQPKPRPKLTCVLPFTIATKAASRLQTFESSCPRSAQERLPDEEVVSLLSMDVLDTNDNDYAPRDQVSLSVASSVHGPVQEDNLHSSPLFIPEETLERSSPSPRPLPTQEEFLFPGSDISALSQSPPKPPTVPDEAVTIADLELDIDTPSLVNNENPRPRSPFQVSPRVPNPFDTFPGRSNSSDIRQFRRVFSENDAVEDDTSTVMPEPVVPEARSPLGLLSNPAAKESPPKSKSPSKIQRCASDTNALDTDSHDRRGSTEEGVKAPTGPWTEDEAFLLFDWWPADVQKPVYWRDQMEQALPRMMAPAAPDVRPGITTARQYLFLRNE